ncbi:MAG: hypothetical protein WCJ95_18685, partial [Mariniphaga sp.]
MNSKILLTIVALVISIGAFSQSVGINSDGSTPNSSAILDISSVNQGLLIPRITLTGANDAATIASPATSLLVYNLTNGSGLIPGIYYNTGTAAAPVWTRLSDTASLGLTPTIKAATLAAAVPYTGATGAVNLGAYDLTVNGLTVGLGTGAIASNTAIGNGSLLADTKGNSNTAIGKSSLYKNTLGSLNTALGDSALVTNTTGNRNTAFGYNADVTTGALTNATAIGYMAKVAASNTIQLGNSNVTLVKTSGAIQAGAVTGTSLSVTGSLTSTLATGTAPLVVTSTTPVANLNIGGNAATATTATNATNTAITNDIITETTVYPTFVNAITGNLPQKTAGTKLSFVPSTGILAATGFVGSGARLTGVIAATNANLTGPITSIGNTTSVASQTGTGSKFVMDTSPTLVTPVIGAATGTSLSVSGSLTSTVATGTAPLVVTSSTPVTNLNIGGNAATVTTNANLTGDVTSSGNTTTLSTSGVTANTYGSATTVPVFAVDAKGRVTGVTNTTITGTSPIGSSLTSGNIIMGSNNNLAASVVPTGDITITNGGVTSISANAITTSKITNANVTNAKLDKINIPLSGFGIATADVAMGANKITSVADPILAQDAATKFYVDAASTGNASALATEVTNRTSADATLTTNLAAETTRASGAESTLTTNLAS